MIRLITLWLAVMSIYMMTKMFFDFANWILTNHPMWVAIFCLSCLAVFLELVYRAPIIDPKDHD